MAAALRKWTIPAGIVLIALAARLVTVALVWSHARMIPNSDAATYDAFARLMMSGWGWVSAPLASREPLYPLLMVFAYALPGPEVGVLIILQALLGTLTVAIVYFGLRSLVRESVARWSALFVALNPHLVPYTGELYRENLIIPLLAGFFVGVLHLGRSPTRRNALLTMLLLVLLAHTDLRFVMYMGALPVFLLVLGNPLGRAVRTTGIALVFFLLFMIPYQVRMYVALGKPAIITDRAEAQWIPLLKERFGGSDTKALAEERKAAWLAGWEVSKQAALDTLAADERAVFTAGRRPETRKLQTCWFNFREFWRFSRREGTYRPYPDGRYTGIWSPRHKVASFLAIFPFLILLPFAWYRSNPLERQVANVIMAFLVVHTVFHVVVHALERYRIPMEVLTSVIIAISVVNIMESLRARLGTRPAPGAAK